MNDERKGIMEELTPKIRSISSKSLLGTKVNNDQGEALGKIEEVMVNLESGNVISLIMSTGSLLKKRVAIPWEMLKIDDESQALSLDMDKDFLERIPAYQADQ
jgi:sporulation protein YlmC with PRC-barrel domain